jgi:hypothetical protein
MRDLYLLNRKLEGRAGAFNEFLSHRDHNMNFDDLLGEWTHAEFRASQAHEEAQAALRAYHDDPAEARRCMVEEALRARNAAKARIDEIVDRVFGTNQSQHS